MRMMCNAKARGADVRNSYRVCIRTPGVSLWGSGDLFVRVGGDRRTLYATKGLGFFLS
jgi:hypothetical protein